ncbi:MAG: DUF1501 domain-containing protein, partial [Verrucomicrobia bacterium]|nr:DUF1501 domain-containing protein [Verrucomicrobiota bacterium]
MPKPYRPSWCNSSEHLWRPSRREFLQVGSLGAFGLTLGRFLELQARGASVVDGKAKSKEPAAKSVIHIYLPGGMAAQESWDPKLLAPLEYRGPLGTVRTKIDGVHFSEHLSKTAQ